MPRYNFIQLSTPSTQSLKSYNDNTNNNNNNNNNNNTTYYKVSSPLTMTKQMIPTTNSQGKQNKVSKYSKLTIEFEFGDGEGLSSPANRIFKFAKNDLPSLFINAGDKENPDYAMLFLSSFKIITTENEFAFPVTLKFIGLPTTIHPEISRDILIPQKKQNQNINNTGKIIPIADLIKGSQKKEKENVLPIPDPVFQILDDPNAIISFPISSFKSEAPRSFCKCKKLDNFNYSCEHDRDTVQDSYHTFNLFTFSIICNKLDGTNWAKSDNKRVSVQVEMKYYFLHHFDK
ncbi:hypothetical protein DLAC_01841 [Tieghemostelium lacteum]|uniref:Uncharacterized protein n=1 Tax=Tieghemostelium lacteum TaxID=361077 RepID=A0A152A6R9_TIELA|nr:hypothetical protein DLAC_01841 [Tieghemostelium lacteum]|eukprot:KYR01825.1 hypothetical protein DLAC_01841 [Tieghemostelium lacteum]